VIGGAAGGPSVSLLVPNMNNEPILEEFFEKLAAHTTYPRVEVVSVDDGSTDGSRAILRRWQDQGPWQQFTVIEQENGGAAAAFNRCIEAASGDLLVRLDGDATVETPGWIERMVALHAVDDRVGLIVAKIVFDTGYIHSFGRSVVDPDGLRDRCTHILERRGRRTLDSAVERPLESKARGGEVLTEVDTALGCCTSFTREVADRVGGADTVFSPVWIEDDDFGLAARREGFKVFYLPEVRVVHHTERRNPRHGPGAKARRTARERAGRLVPMPLRRAFAARSAVSREALWRVEVLRGHYQSWNAKWGFDPLNPDLDAVRARWGGSEVCWAYDDELREAGEEIARAYGRSEREPVRSGR
jgi:GT2 family glycosyltransferase